MAKGRDIYQIKIYSIENEQQEHRMDKFLKDAYIPAMHRAGISNVGVFKPVERVCCDRLETGSRWFNVATCRFEFCHFPTV